MAGDLPLSVKITLPNGTTYAQPTGLFINNEFVYPKQKKTFETISPATEEVISSVYEGREEDVDIAVDAAEKAFKESGWATGDPLVRSRVLNKLADLYEKNAETLAYIEALDNGKCISDARGDIALSTNCLRSAAGWADKINGDIVETGSTHFSYTRREPIGVCGQIVAWNFPVLLLTWKLGPAAATGNAMVFKSAESTPLSALFIANLCKEAGFPPGIMNVVTGFGKTVGHAIAAHPKIHKVAFTGSTAVGKHIMKTAAETNLKKVTLELGGKSPQIILPDADIDNVVKCIMTGIFYNTGEVCCAGSRLYIHEDIYDKVMATLQEKMASIKLGDPFDEDTVMGAQNSKVQLDKILKYIDIGKKEGAKIVTGGERVGKTGFFVQPTVFGDVKENMQIVKDEIFGPVVTAAKFSNLDDAIANANNTPYGLAAGVHSKDINKVIAASHKLEAGTVWVNTYNDFHASVPFGGFKESGFGKEMGRQSLDSYTQVKAVRIGLQ